jgi:sucrose-6-phosphate hydrolase SacC (GH32 family)
MVGWMINWQYAPVLPTIVWKGALSLIRELSLKETQEGIRLIQQPLAEYKSLRRKSYHWQQEILTPDKNQFLEIKDNCLEILAEFEITSGIEQLGFHVGMGEVERATIGYLPREQRIFVDRSHCGLVDFHQEFGRVHSAPLAPIENRIHLHIFIDRCSVEIFANDGLEVITDCILPSTVCTKLAIFSEGENALLNALDVYQLSSACYSVNAVNEN